jgi:two-component system, OmpR family, phosphate regulon response regulator PhoB
VRSVLYRFPDPHPFERLVCGPVEEDLELPLPASEGSAQDGEWVLAVFELGPERRTTSFAARVALAPDGPRLVFEPRDWAMLARFAQQEARRAPSQPPVASGRVVRKSEAGQDADAAGASAVPAESSRRVIGAGAKILIVDDDPDIRGVVSAMLAAVGLSAEPVGSAEEALERVEMAPYDLLVLDWNLPKMTGIDLCRILRGRAAFENMPILFLSANASSQDIEEAFASGADDYVVKPFRAPELGARVFSLLRRAEIAAS